MKGEFIIIETPEKIKIQYQIASPLVRLAAHILDSMIYGILMFIIYLIFFTFNIAGKYVNIFIDTEIIGSLSYFFFFVIIFVLQWAYYIIFEMLLNGKSIGKMMLGLRVINYEGKYLDLPSSVLRNFLRIFDITITFYLGALISMILNKDFRRTGDLVGNTIVIKEMKVKIDIPDFKIHQFSNMPSEVNIPLTKKLSEKELYIIRTFLNSYEELPPEKRELIARKIAFSIKNKLLDPEDSINPVEYLKSVYRRHQNE